MSSLEDLVTDALTSTNTDADLAKALVDSGALSEILRRGTYDDTTVQQRLHYSSPAAMRAALSKARRNKASFPIPVTEGRRWSRTVVDQYRKNRRARPSEPAESSEQDQTAGSTSTRSTVTDTSSISIASTSGSGSLGGGTGEITDSGGFRRDPDQRRTI